ncbi:KIR protein [Plasmodium coatneyi]|uniref:KIR protein n=1 Tax=Plasmodium coatneyi TaxID=208452 RepID=A0A1B1DWP0_9APIC|nr:KIR protein [Plasmodium coatneyi]ANQ07178.1 KIR protein [Plasmodium coatneyi]
MRTLWMPHVTFTHTEYEKKRLFQGELCYFLYFWIGGLLSKESASANFKNNLSEICSKMMGNKVFGTHGCKDICDKVDQTLFNDRKTVFDFLYDHTTIRALLKNGGSNVVNKCERYIKDVKAAKAKVESHCDNDGNSHEYCTKFRFVNGTTIQRALLHLEDALTTAKQRIAEEESAALSKAEANLRQAVLEEKEDQHPDNINKNNNNWTTLPQKMLPQQYMMMMEQNIPHNQNIMHHHHHLPEQCEHQIVDYSNNSMHHEEEGGKITKM